MEYGCGIFNSQITLFFNFSGAYQIHISWNIYYELEWRAIYVKNMYDLIVFKNLLKIIMKVKIYISLTRTDDSRTQ